jgi:hypothetical protein
MVCPFHRGSPVRPAPRTTETATRAKFSQDTANRTRFPRLISEELSNKKWQSIDASSLKLMIINPAGRTGGAPTLLLRQEIPISDDPENGRKLAHIMSCPGERRARTTNL